MNEVQKRSETSDFSIARILADDRKVSRDVRDEKCTGDLKTIETDNKDRRNANTFQDKDLTFADSSNLQDKQFNFKAEQACSHAVSSVPSDNANVAHIQGHELTWLRYTRYRPPKLPRRSTAGKGLRRRPGVHPRIPFSSFQLQALEDKYKKSAYLSRNDVIEMSTSLRLPQNRNRRARERRELRNTVPVT